MNFLRSWFGTNKKKNVLAFLFGLIIGIAMLEVILRIHNPLPSRVKGNKIILTANQKYIFINNDVKKLDREIIHTKNSLGFRGEELPINNKDYLTIITAGGSTTECSYLSDSKTWSYLLEQKLKHYYRDVWLNNAGVDGLSTFGVTVLLQDYLIKLRPKVIIFLVGCNDWGRDDLNKYDKSKLRNYYTRWEELFSKNSELVSFIISIRRLLNAKRKGLGNLLYLNLNKLDKLILTDEQINKILNGHKMMYLPGYKNRLLQFITISRKNGIEPIFVTQPTLVGKGTDPSTGVNLETVELVGNRNGRLFWETLQLYNGITKQVCKEADVCVVDLANTLPKDSKYFYDILHFTNEGAEEVSRIIFGGLKDYFDIKYKDFIKNLQ